MFVTESFESGARPLKVMAAVVLLGMGILVAGLWYVQVLSAKRFQADLQVQSFRTVRVPSFRGRILDRNGVPLADNRPSYNINLYLEELRSQFREEYRTRVKPEFWAMHPGVTNLSGEVSEALQRQARYRVVSNILAQVSHVLREPRVLQEKVFHRHYETQRSLPLTLLRDVPSEQMARFIETLGYGSSLELDVHAMRLYPMGATAAHILGHLKRDDRVESEDEISCKFHLPDYVGVRGLEAAYDEELRGRAGVRSVLVNSMAYRQGDEMVVEPVPGNHLVLTLDYLIQHETERALAKGASQGAAVVMEVDSGDLLAVASVPTFDPNLFLAPIPFAEYAKLNDEILKPMFNRAVYGLYPPGSIFKIVTGLAAMEAGVLDPATVYLSQGYFQVGGKGRVFADTAGAGEFDFERAFYLSSNPYFMEYGLRAGPERLIAWGRKFGFGELTGLPTRQETVGYFPSGGALRKRDGSAWMPGDTANFSIGHGEMLVTPLQMVVMAAAVANGGKVLQPRLVAAIEPADSTAGTARRFPAGVVRRSLEANLWNLEVIRRAMLADVRHPSGTGRRAHIPGFQICGKTGTAELPGDDVTWFVSYAPAERPRYAVAVVVTGGLSGGGTCAPIAREIYESILRHQPRPATTALTSATPH